MTAPVTDAPAGGVATPTRGGQVLVVVGIVLLAVNLRPAAVSVGPVLAEIRAGIGMSGSVAGLLTSLPVIAFAVFGALAPRAAGRVGPHRLTVVALVAVLVGLVTRSRVGDSPSFLLLSLLALAGMATANVVLPSLVKLHFPDRVGTMTAVYSTALAIGLTGASVLTVPAAEALGDWRDGLAVWAVVALVALVPWLGLVGRDRASRRAALRNAGSGRISLADVARTPLGRWMALLFGLQSLQAYAIFGWFADIYRDAGFSPTTAGILLGVITGMSIPLSFLIPSLAARLHGAGRSVAPLVWALSACYPVGYLGLVVAPSGGAWVWAVVVGAGASTFPLVLTLIGLRARTPEGTAALSGFTQSAGYLLAVLGPFGVGALHDLSGGWTVPLAGLAVLVVPLVVAGLAVASPRYLEDELAALPTRTDRTDRTTGAHP